ncbi:MAG: hypothetical protein J6K88_05190 [Oscillospiraceae bacterium]|nr:hypothetical protein [Oscillospiraceae bacterium]
MAKQGMKRPERTHTKPKNDVPPVPELQGKEKSGKTSAEKPISDIYPAIDNDLARDNLENDITAADLQDL